jgi:amino acid adenylation domain-containing protein
MGEGARPVRQIVDPLEQTNVCSDDELSGYRQTAREVPTMTFKSSNVRPSGVLRQPIHRLFEEQTRLTPDSRAVSFRGQSLTYAELNARANQLAHHLNGCGLHPGALVGVAVDRSLDMLVAVLGILKAGAAYIPLDPYYPSERLAYMLADAAPQFLVTHALLADRLAGSSAHRVILDDGGALRALSQERTSNPEASATASDLAYVIYTSGSTGRPKGVEVCHDGLTNVICDLTCQINLHPEDKFVAVTTLSFDIAGLELYGPLICGAEVVIATRDQAIDGEALGDLLAESDASVMQATPSTWRLLLQRNWRPRAPLRALCGGEPLDRQLALDLVRAGITLFNLYGPTETTIWSSIFSVRGDPGPSPWVSIGRPIANTEMYILDERLRPVPPGVRGELYIGGVGLARGYLHQPQLTKARFISHPFSDDPGARLYRTGDVARWLEDGDIEFLGRVDSQVKIRGYRIELGEVHSALCEHPDVAECAVTAHSDSSENTRLVAYWVARGGATCRARDLREHLERKLPAYMIPSAFVSLEAMPRTANGKLDRNALPPPDATALVREEVNLLPATPIEQLLSDTWALVLGVRNIGRDDNFFDLGGHSLLAARVLSRIFDTFGVHLQVSDLFEAPVLKSLAARVEQAQRDGARRPQDPPLVPVARKRDLAPSFPQEWMWERYRSAPESGFQNVPCIFRLQGALDEAALGRAFEAVVDRHEALRTHFEETAAGLRVVITAEPIRMALVSVDSGDLPERESKALSLARQEARKPFDLSWGPVIRATLFRVSADLHFLSIIIHHIATDSWSESVILGELGALYDAFRHGQPSPLPPLPLQYQDFAVWEQSRLEHGALARGLAYWRSKLAGELPPFALPTDHPRPDAIRETGTGHSFSISRSLTDRVTQLAYQEHATLFMTLLSVLKVLLLRCSGRHDVVVGTSVANRRRIETDRVVGPFFNRVPLRTNLSGNPTMREVIRRVRETCLEAHTHDDIPIIKIAEALSISHDALYRFMFVLQTVPVKLTISGIDVTEIGIPAISSKVDLVLNMHETPDGLSGTFHFNTDNFEPKTIQEFAVRFVELLHVAVGMAPPALKN